MVLAFLLKDMNELFNNIFQELHRGDTVYYVIGSGAMYSIKKTTIVDIQIRRHGQVIQDQTASQYQVYLTEDGQIISQFLRETRDELSPSQVFMCRMDAIHYIMDCLRKEIKYQKQIITSAQQCMKTAQRVLKSYEKYGKQEKSSIE